MGEKASGVIWHLEVHDPHKTTYWHPVLKFNEDQYSTYQELAADLNKINAPIQVRLVRHVD